jgi:hypothetical protein
MHRSDSLATRIMTFIASLPNGATTADVVRAFSKDNEASVRATVGQLREFLARSPKVKGKWHTYTVNARGRSTFGLKSGTKNGNGHAETETFEQLNPSITLPGVGLTIDARIARDLHSELNKVFGG